MTAPWYLTAAEMDAEWDALRAENLALRERVAAMESREVCAVAHDGDVTTCGYCQRDALRLRVTQLEADLRAATANPWRKDGDLVTRLADAEALLREAMDCSGYDLPPLQDRIDAFLAADSATPREDGSHG